jgi:2-amino-4-hydroxy-6-hydroxymethyldihydropteridine diphosphokinase/dihydropteroate synthase
MVILGIGTNLGDRLTHLRLALRAIKNIPGLSVQQVSPVYVSDALLPENAPRHWDIPYLNFAVRCETTHTPYELLAKLKATEQLLGRTPEKEWGPRVIDIDLLAWDDLIQYDAKLHIPHEHLHERPFALWPLADVAPHWVYPLPGLFQGKTAIELANQWGPRFNSRAPLHIKQLQQRVDTPSLMGIVNLTPDSFSADGLFNNPVAALKHVHHLVAAGAEIIDLGAESTGPTATALDPLTEWQRLEPLLSLVIAERPNMLIPPKISIDTRHASVAKKALALGADWINDVTGLDDITMRNVVAEQSCDIVFMHHLGVPVNKTNTLPLNQDPVSFIYSAAEKRIQELEMSGIQRERLIFDVGIGYGKTAEQSLELIKHIKQFQSLGVRLLVGHSRKSFLSQFTAYPAAERDWETVAVSQFLARQAVDYLRVHNVDANARGLKTAAALATV